MLFPRLPEARNNGDAPDGDVKTLHVRCGSDIQGRLQEAGFVGDFLEYSDPLCQGPVLPGDNALAARVAFVAKAYGARVGQSKEQTAQKLGRAEEALRQAADRYDRIVIWVEEDSYDQINLIRCLKEFAKKPPDRLELVSASSPGGGRFVALGHLAPDALGLLWRKRQTLSRAEMMFAVSAWDMFASPNPCALAKLAKNGSPHLLHFSAALMRHCRELPGLDDGLGLTERLILQILSEGPQTVDQIFRILTDEKEPAPWLGDVMLAHIVDQMRYATPPIFLNHHDKTLSLTAMGKAVLARKIDWLALSPPERWVGGVRIPSDPPCWRWDEQNLTPVFR